jgi:CRP-like cAMP-binding protein
MGLSDFTPLSRFVYKLMARSPLGPAERVAILSLNGSVRQIEADRDVVSEGQRVEHASFVVSGLVGSVGQTCSGERQIIALHLAGDMANLHSLVVPESSEALQALAATTIVQIPHSELREVAECYPRLASAFWRESAVRNAIAAQWMINLGCRAGLARLAHLLCEIACRENGVEGRDGISFSFLATQAHLSDMLGLTPVHVNRVIQSLRARGLIHYGRRSVTVTDWNGLASVGEFDSAYLQLGSRLGRSAIVGRHESMTRFVPVALSAQDLGPAY